MKIAIIFGGKSSEHDISVITALQAINVIDKNKYSLFPVYITKDGVWLSGQKLLDKDTYFTYSRKAHIIERSIYAITMPNILLDII